MNQKLIELYSKYWDKYLISIRDGCHEPAAFPFLIAVQDAYKYSEEKVMICGQETQGWGNEYDDLESYPTVEQVIDIYKGFVWTDGYNSPYWNFIKAIKKALPAKGFVVNNIVKVGKRYGAGCDEEIYHKSMAIFPVGQEEKRILAPNAIVFLTGPNYDCKIRDVFGDFEVKPVSLGIKCLDELIFFDESMPRTIRCYHPGFLRRNRLSNLYLEEIIKFCR